VPRKKRLYLTVILGVVVKEQPVAVAGQPFPHRPDNDVLLEQLGLREGIVLRRKYPQAFQHGLRRFRVHPAHAVVLVPEAVGVLQGRLRLADAAGAPDCLRQGDGVPVPEPLVYFPQDGLAAREVGVAQREVDGG